MIAAATVATAAWAGSKAVANFAAQAAMQKGKASPQNAAIIGIEAAAEAAAAMVQEQGGAAGQIARAAAATASEAGGSPAFVTKIYLHLSKALGTKEGWEQGYTAPPPKKNTKKSDARGEEESKEEADTREAKEAIEAGRSPESVGLPSFALLCPVLCMCECARVRACV